MAAAECFHDFISYLLLILCVPLLGALTIFLKIKKYFKSNEQNKSNIAGEVAVITGSARGLGRDIANELAKRGCNIAVVDIREELAQETAEYLINIYGIKAKAYKVDVSEYQQLVELRDNVTKDLGDTTILVHNAAILLLPVEPKPEDVQKMINVNFTAVYFANQIFLPKMKELNRGYILTISSLGALLNQNEFDVYCACKSAIRSLIAALRLGLKSENSNIKLTTVMPWFLTSNKLVEELLYSTILPKLCPSVDGQTAARIAVEAMLNGEEELTIRRIFLYFYKILELFSAAAKDHVLWFLGKWTLQELVQQPECQEILNKRDTLQLL